MKLRFWMPCLGVVLLFAATAFSGSNCEKPSENTVKCHAPSNDVSTCTGWAENVCSGKSGYSINDFPKEAVSVPPPAAYTEENQRNCYQEKACYWDTSVTPAKCAAPAQWSPWTLGNKIEIDASRFCL